ncbi:membrane protein insertion efficiency factor YidD [Candidatus Roizmanbacteria bacterium]|nr:membrane protein insertion efficiency factor YidD [Candidatus Roizmanbacteria bacterium]
MKMLILRLIRLYQQTKLFRSSVLKTLFLTDAVCRFRPTCSQYVFETVDKYGVLKGLFLGVKRIIRCHPWSKGGYDPVP